MLAESARNELREAVRFRALELKLGRKSTVELTCDGAARLKRLVFFDARFGVENA
jgi:hypothetical protein